MRSLSLSRLRRPTKCKVGCAHHHVRFRWAQPTLRREREAKARPPQSFRRGAFTVVMLVCLLIATMLLGTLLKIALLQNRQSGRELFRVQAAWLAESGLDRAVQRLSADSRYAGETWTIDAERLASRDAAHVAIQIQPVEQQTQQRLIVVQASYPATGPDQARVTRQASVTLNKEP